MDTHMQIAIDEAKKGLKDGGIPIGSVLVHEDKIVGRGHNLRVQKNDPIMHAEISCLHNAGRVGSYQGMTLYSTLMPCYLCAGAAVQFGIKRVIVADSHNFPGARDFMQEHGIEVVDLDIPEAKEMMSTFIEEHPELWKEDIGKK